MCGFLKNLFFNGPSEIRFGLLRIETPFWGGMDEEDICAHVTQLKAEALKPGYCHTVVQRKFHEFRTLWMTILFLYVSSHLFREILFYVRMRVFRTLLPRIQN